jgi:hypothetical protein
VLSCLQGACEDCATLVRECDDLEAVLRDHRFAREDGKTLIALQMLWPAMLEGPKESIASLAGIQNNDYVTCTPVEAPGGLLARGDMSTVRSTLYGRGLCLVAG